MIFRGSKYCIFISYLGGRAEEAGLEWRRGTEDGVVGDAPPRRALVTDGLVGGDH